MDRLDAEATDDALRVLQNLATWELTPQAWDRAAVFLERIDEALSSTDAYSLRRAVAGLTSTVRVKALRIGSDDVRGIPPLVLERQAALIHRLVERRPPFTAPQDSAGFAEPRDGDSG